MSNKFKKTNSKPVFETSKDKKTMSIEELKSYKGFEHLTDKEAEEILQSILWFCEIIGRAYMMEKNKNEVEMKADIVPKVYKKAI